MAIDVSAYLERIGCKGLIGATPENLARLQRGHLLNVPYDSLDFFDRCVGTLAVDELFDRIVRKHRGGYCFELNGLFNALLRALTFETEEYFGRWLYGENLPVPPRRHRVVCVKFRKTSYLADVGIGMQSPLTPLKFVYDEIQMREGVNYRVVKDATLDNLVQFERDSKWFNYYSFDTTPQLPIDFGYVHWYLANHPDSPFLKTFLVHRMTENGRCFVQPTQDPETGETAWGFQETLPDGKIRCGLLHTVEEKAAALKRLFGFDYDPRRHDALAPKNSCTRL